MEIKLSATKIKLSLDQEHVNKMCFKATVAFIDTPTDGTPGGTDSPLVLRRSAVEAGLDTFAFMGIDCEWDDNFCSDPESVMTDHNARFKIGVVQQAYIEGNELKIDGIIYKNDFPDITYFIKNASEALGFSIEAVIECSSDEQYTYAESITFTGTAMLFARLAAFNQTSIDYIAAKNKLKETKEMNEEQMKALLESFMVSMKATVEEIKVDLSAQVEKSNVEIATLAVALAEVKEVVSAEPVVEPVVVELAAVPVVEPVVAPARVTAQTGGTFVTAGRFDDPEGKVKAIWASDSKKDWNAKMAETIQVTMQEIQKK